MHSIDHTNIGKRRLNSPYNYLRVLGLYSKNNLLEDVLQMYKNVVNVPDGPDQQSPTKEKTLNEVDYYSGIQDKSVEGMKTTQNKLKKAYRKSNRKVRSPQPVNHPLTKRLFKVREKREV